MNISIQELVKIVVSEVIAELTRQGIQVNASSEMKNLSGNGNAEKFDLSRYKTPVLTEKHLLKLNESKTEIIIPKGTVITPGAREIIRKRNLRISH